MLMNNICYDLCGLIFSIFVIIIMIYKKNSIKSLDEKIFKYQILSSVAFGLSCIFYYISCIYFADNTFLINLSIRLFYITLVIHQALLFVLVSSLVLLTNEVIKKKYSNKYLYVYIAFILCIILATTLTPSVSVMNDEGLFHITGTSMKVSYFFTLLNTFSLLITLILNRKHMKELNLIPFYILMLVYSLSASSSFNAFESYSLSYLFFTAIDFVFYMTIENKDVQLINAYNSKKAVLEDKFKGDRKYMVDVSNKIRTPMHTILGNTNYLNENKTINAEEKNTIISEIKTSCDNLYNDILMNKEVKND